MVPGCCMEPDAAPAERSPATNVLLGLVLGAAAGLACNMALAPPLGAAPSDAYARVVWLADRVMQPIGQLFLRLLFMVVVPMVFASLVLGVTSVGDLRRIGRIGARTLLWFVVSTAVAAVLGLTLVNTFTPGSGLDPAISARLQEQFASAAEERLAAGRAAGGFSLDMLVNVVPRNVVRAASDDREALGVIVFALLFGVACAQLGRARVGVLLDCLQAIYDVCVKLLGYAMRLAPVGVFALVFATAAKLGLPLLQALGGYLLVALGGLLLHLFVVLGAAAWWFVGIRPLRFFARCRGLLVTAFSTSSSNATLPTTIRTATDEFGVPAHIAGFVLPLGATMNMNGTALFEGIVVLFLAQVAGIELQLSTQVLVMALSVLTAIGAAGVPGGALPLIAVVLAQVGVPPGMLALILGVDRIVDMTRTLPNVLSDLVCALWVSKREGVALRL
jgi:Na+/H+-dicarboxylate symporter